MTCLPLIRNSATTRCGCQNRYQFRADRACYFNYYACALTLARAYLWAGDKTNALKYANEVIHSIDDKTSTPFSWIDYTNMQQTALNELDMAFTCEHLFHLTVNNWEDIANYYFAKKRRRRRAQPLRRHSAGHLRGEPGTRQRLPLSQRLHHGRRHKVSLQILACRGGKYNDLYPLLRMSEAWYIAAECLEDSEPAKAVELINEVRANRNLKLFPLDSSLTPQQIQQEIYKEYRKEFVGEAGNSSSTTSGATRSRSPARPSSRARASTCCPYPRTTRSSEVIPIKLTI